MILVIKFSKKNPYSVDKKLHYSQLKPNPKSNLEIQAYYSPFLLSLTSSAAGKTKAKSWGVALHLQVIPRAVKLINTDKGDRDVFHQW